MAYPTSGLLKIFPSTVSIIDGTFAYANDATPQAARPVADLQTYYNLRTPSVVNGPCANRDDEVPAASGVYVPSVDTYELQFSPSSIGIEFYNGSYPSAIIATHDFLDAAFPMGMLISQPLLYFNGQVLFGPNRDRQINSILFKYFGSTIYTYTPGVGLLNGNISTPSTAIISNPLISWSFIQVMKQFGFSIDVLSAVSANAGTPRAINAEFFILAVYNTAFFQFTSDTENALPGSVVEITSSADSFQNFDRDQFKIYWDDPDGDVNSNFPGWAGGILIPRNNILRFTNSIFKFIIPTGLGIPYGGKRLMLTGVGNSAFFVGEFPIQNYNIQLVDGSGLYKLTEGQAYDTYYDRSVSPVTTVNIKIP